MYKKIDGGSSFSFVYVLLMFSLYYRRTVFPLTFIIHCQLSLFFTKKTCIPYYYVTVVGCAFFYILLFGFFSSIISPHNYTQQKMIPCSFDIYMKIHSPFNPLNQLVSWNGQNLHFNGSNIHNRWHPMLSLHMAQWQEDY